MRIPPLLADFIYTRICKPIYAKFLTLPVQNQNCELNLTQSTNYNITCKNMGMENILVQLSRKSSITVDFI